MDNYNAAQLSTKEDISKRQGVAITEHIADEVRIWFKDYQLRTGKFPEFPSQDAGGSRHLLSRQGMFVVANFSINFN